MSVFKAKLALPVVLGLESRVSHIIGFCSIPEIFWKYQNKNYAFM